MKHLNFVIFLTFLYQIGTYASTDEKSKGAKSALAQVIDLPDNIKVKTKDEHIIPLPKSLINTFELVKTALENDQDAKEIPLPSVNRDAYDRLVTILYNAQSQALSNQKEISQHVNQLINEKNINAIYQAAEYLSINKQNYLFKALAQKYAQLIHEYFENIAKGVKPVIDTVTQAKSLVNAKYYLSEIANQYFLLYEDDIDKKLGIISKPTVQELIDHGFLTRELGKAYSNNEEWESTISGPEMTVKRLKGLLKLTKQPTWLARWAVTDLDAKNTLDKIKLLVKSESDIVPILIGAAAFGHPTVVKYILGLGINARNRIGKTALTYAILQLEQQHKLLDLKLRAVALNPNYNIDPDIRSLFEPNVENNEWIKKVSERVKRLNEVINLLKAHGVISESVETKKRYQ